MPHIKIEQSQNVKDNIDFENFFKEAIDIFAELEVTKTRDGIKCRKINISNSYLNNPDNVFIHLEIALLTGREAEKLKKLGEKIYQLLAKYYQISAKEQPNCFSVEIREMNRELYFM